MKSGSARYLALLLGAAYLTTGGGNLAFAQASSSVEEKQACIKNLETIYQAIQAFEKDHKALPYWLSDLVPDYLNDAAVLTCPVCRRTGRIEGPPLADPKIASSYLFEFCPVPLGRAAPDAPLQTRREWKQRQMSLLGPVVPVVRCRHHNPVLNLSREGKIYESPGMWELVFTNRVSEADLTPARLFSRKSGGEAVQDPKVLYFAQRDPATPKQLLDLGSFYNAMLSESWHGGSGNDLAALTPGRQTLGGIEFDARGIIQLGSRTPSSAKFPAQVKGIRVDQKCKRLHFLHSAGWGGVGDEGKQVGSYLVHFVDNPTRLEIPIYYGRDMRNWHVLRNEPTAPPELTVAWTGTNAVSKRTNNSIRLFLTTWTNLIPDDAIESIDFVSSQASPAPFLIAITVD